LTRCKGPVYRVKRFHEDSELLEGYKARDAASRPHDP
jgi:hypothetical protein